jgi:predicted Zn-dependent protease
LLLAPGDLALARFSGQEQALALARLEDYNLTRMLAAAGERQAPSDIRFVRLRAQIELAAGAYHPALEAAKKVLARLPKDGDALRVQKEAMAKLRELAR